ncbi:aromatic ring-hydroxylating oxygenase subunit alpha [Novosphingobium percolationis]|uniref:aromatic ring-hydroxylating oxygenase subunit alpha n=1 Tax=Novosphingobium percolationis TaxID=2871811 RepID=UPI001CD2E17D|nr:aromatic ring-hydroxylating dioxygenase subunit alpha [Novosphingobium percolationis]
MEDDRIVEQATTTRDTRLSAQARSLLEGMATDLLQHRAQGTFPLEDAVMRLDASAYTCPERFEAEKQRIFRRVPLVLGASCELPSPGDFKTMDVAGIPVLVVRHRDGSARALFNSCTHRGAAVAQGCGTAARFTCPYHGWTFAQDGALVGVASASDFGAVDKAALGLKAFPTVERAGLIWAILDAETPHDPADLLGGIDALLDGFGLADWTFVETRALPGPNWKLAFDAHLEFYHLPVLHRATFGPERSNRAFYYRHGPHQRVIGPAPRPGDAAASEDAADDLYTLGRLPQGDEPVNPLMIGEWIVFPGVSINIFHPNGRRGVFISTVLPGTQVGESVTVQTYLSETPPDAETRAKIAELCAFLAHVVGEEDLPTSAHQQKALAAGVLREVRFGRNEGGLHHFHKWIDMLVDSDDAALAQLLADPCRPM